MDGLLNENSNHKNSNKQKSGLKKRKINRGNKKKKEAELCIMSANAAQLKGKLNSFKSELKQCQAGIFTIQESHFATKGKLKIEDFEIFEAIRKKAKGGTIIGVHKALRPCLIEEYESEFEILVVEITISNKRIRIITGYGPQECWPERDRMLFFSALEQEIIKAELAGSAVVIEMDANSKLGTDFIPGDKHEKSQMDKCWQT